jgi:hypothetical protein
MLVRCVQSNPISYYSTTCFMGGKIESVLVCVPLHEGIGIEIIY